MKLPLPYFLIAGWMLLSPLSHSQEIRRALPVDSPAPVSPDQYDNPEWMQRVLPALPVEHPPQPQEASPIPAPSPLPTPISTPTALPTATPLETPPSIKPAVPVSTPQSPLDLHATSPERDSSDSQETIHSSSFSQPSWLDSANGFYARKMYESAIETYERFLIAFPTPQAPGRDEALYRLAESHRFLAHDEAARASYERLIKEYDKGAYLGAAAYRLAEILYAEGNFDSALALYQRAGANSEDNEVQLTAKFYEARCLDKLNQPGEAAKIYEDLASTKENNPYLYYARLALAESRSRKGEKKEALADFLEVASQAKSSSLRAEASIKAGLLSAELGDAEQALKLFAEVEKIPEAGDWRGIAKMGSLRANYALNHYKAITDLSAESIDSLPEEFRPEAFLMVGNAYRQTDHPKEAAQWYQKLIENYPRSPSATDARFQKLVALYTGKSSETLDEINSFLLHASSTEERTKALLLKAEWLFQQKKFSEAAEVYASLQDLPLDSKQKSDALYKEGWCLMQEQKSDKANQVFSKFISENPDHPLVASAIAQRGKARIAMKEDEGALADFNLLIEKHPHSKEQEFALQQKALLLGQRQDTEGLTATFTKLLEDYPETAAAAQAHFWIGWAAFEQKDYPKAIEQLEKARKQDPANYGERSTLRILLAYYNTKDRDHAVQELAQINRQSAPAEILRWLGLSFFEEGDYVKAEDYLLPLTQSGSSLATPEILLNLSQTEAKLKKWKSANDHASAFLGIVRDPLNRARRLLAKADALSGEKRYDEASGLVDEAMLLQPEGLYNALGRMAHADILSAKGESEKAARAYATIALLYEDPKITPESLQKAEECFRKVGLNQEAERTAQERMRRYPDFQKTKISTSSGSSKKE